MASVCARAGAQTPPATGDAVPDEPVLRVVPLPDDHRIDGHLDEPVWAQAPAIGNLTMIDPVEGVEPGRRTVVKALAGRDALVFGILCHHDSPDEIVSWSMGKDVDFSGQDHVHLVLGPFRDGRSGYVFTISPTGARRDGLVTARGEAEDSNWDGIWEARAVRTPEGWSAEVRIPSATIGFREGLDAWHFNVERYIFEPLLTLSVSGETNIVRLPGGDFTKDLVAARAALLFSPDLELSSYLQYDTDSRLLGTNTRLHWEATPVADVFLVFNYNVGRSDGAWERDGFEVMLKMQYTFRP